MGKKSKARWAKKAARNAERRAALKEAVEKEGFARRCAAKEMAKEFAKRWIPNAKGVGALCFHLQREDVQRWAKEDGKTVMFMALKRMTKYCRFCGEGKWGCVCRYDEEGLVIEEDHWHPAMPPEEVEVSGKGKCKKKGQNEGLTTPAGKVMAEEGVGPDGAVVSSKTAGGRVLFAEK